MSESRPESTRTQRREARKQKLWTKLNIRSEGASLLSNRGVEVMRFKAELDAALAKKKTLEEKIKMTETTLWKCQGRKASYS